MSVVEEGLVVRLTTATYTKAIVKDRVFSGAVKADEDDDENFPAIGIELVSDTPELCSSGEVGLSHAFLLLNCWSEDQKTTKRLAEQVRLVLNTYKGNAGSIAMLCFIEGGGDIAYEAPEDSDLRLYGVQLQAEVWYRHQVAVP